MAAYEDTAVILLPLSRGVAGDETFTLRRVLSRGDSEHEGVDTISVESQYLWKPVS